MLLERLAFQTKKTPEQLLAFSRTAGRLYKTFEIEKRNGGARTIEQPSRSLKALQRWLERALFRHYPVHHASMGYRPGISIRDNALIHAPYAYTLRMDFKDFFWSFTKDDIVSFFQQGKPANFDITADDIEFLAGIVVRGGRLVMGAPSSPVLTNIMMFKMDTAFEQIAGSFNGRYTRYADDLFFSTNEFEASRRIDITVKATVSSFESPRLKLNADKTCYLSRKSLRKITGLVVTPQGKVSLGRDRKRMVKALLHKAISGELEPDRFDELAGFLNWAKSADPSFVLSLRGKYSSELVDRFSSTAV